MHTCIHAYIQTYIHTYIQTYRHIYIHTYTHSYLHTQLLTYRLIYRHRFSVQTRSWIGPRAVHQPGCKQPTMTLKPSSFSDLSRVGTRPKGHFTARQFRDVTSSDGRHHFLERLLRGVRQFQLVESLLYQMIHRASV